jgi:hypothetical protein
MQPAGASRRDGLRRPRRCVHTARNESRTEELVVIVTRLVPDGAMPRIDEPGPGNCDF